MVVTSMIIKKLDDALFANDKIFINEDSNNVTSFGGEMGILRVDLDKINLGDLNFCEDDPQTIIHVRIMASHNKYENHIKTI